MKRIAYILMIGCMAASFSACRTDGDVAPVSGGNDIVLDMTAGTRSVSRSEAVGAEAEVRHIDVLIFADADDSKAHYERVAVGSEEGQGRFTLAARRNSFGKNEKYWVYLVANSTHSEEEFAAVTDLSDLRGMVQADENIHMTGLRNLPGMPQTFLMDGVAYPAADAAEPGTPGPVVLFDGVESADTELKAVLRRAAAKIVVRIKSGENVAFSSDSEAGEAGYYLRNMPYTTSLVAGVDAPAELRTPGINSGPRFNWTQDMITVTAYAYAHEWEDMSALEQEVRLVVNIPLTYFDPKAENPEGTFLGRSYYQIPVSKNKMLKRNTRYEVTVTVNAPGAEDPSEPTPLDGIEYSVEEWTEKTIGVGGEDDRPTFLYVNEHEMEMHNIEDDHTTLQFSSSSEVTATITKVYYKDKFGQEQVLEKRYPDDPDSDEWGVKTTTGGWNPTTTWSNLCEIRITPDKGINGKIDVFGDIPTNKTIRYITFKVTNEDGQEHEVTVAQYPLEYITNKQSWYSYRDDFKTNDSRPTTYEYAGDRVYGISLATWNISNWNGRYEYEIVTQYSRFSSSNSFFTSKYAVEDKSTGKSRFYYYYYGTNGRRSNASLTEYNARLYHIVLTASSGKYTIGRPRQIFDEVSGLYVTDPGADNAELVSPSFMIASSLSGFLVGGGNLTLDGSDNSLRIAREHCAHYVEVAEDGTVYDDWRLPTRAELDIILNYQGTENEDADAIDFLLNGNYYYHAGGRTYNPNFNVDGAEPRCVRDVYNNQKTGNQLRGTDKRIGL